MVATGSAPPTTPPPSPSLPTTVDESGRWLRIVVIGLVLWCVLALVWASRPITDAVPLTAPLTAVEDPPKSLDVRCNSLLSSSARDDDTPLPTPPYGTRFTRTPCESQHSEGRILLGLDLLAGVIGLALAIPAWRRRRRSVGS